MDLEGSAKPRCSPAALLYICDSGQAARGADRGVARHHAGQGVLRQQIDRELHDRDEVERRARGRRLGARHAGSGIATRTGADLPRRPARQQGRTIPTSSGGAAFRSNSAPRLSNKLPVRNLGVRQMAMAKATVLATTQASTGGAVRHALARESGAWLPPPNSERDVPLPAAT